MNVLIFGGTQFVSRALAQHMIAASHRVDIVTRGLRPLDYSGVRRHFTGSRKDPAFLTVLFKENRYDWIFDISAYTEEDVRLLLAVLQPAPPSRYIFCSSGAVYQPSETFLSETDPTGPNPHWGEYGTDKLAAEALLLQAFSEVGFPVSIVRPPYLYGTGNNLYREAYLFDRLSQQLPLPFPKGDHPCAQFLHIDDFVRMLESLALSSNQNGEVYNLAYPEALSWPDWITTAAQVLEKQPCLQPVTRGEMEAAGLQARDFFPFRHVTYLLNTRKWQDSGLYQPTVSLAKGLARTFSHYPATGHSCQDSRMTKTDEILNRLARPLP